MHALGNSGAEEPPLNRKFGALLQDFSLLWKEILLKLVQMLKPCTWCPHFNSELTRLTCVVYFSLKSHHSNLKEKPGQPDFPGSWLSWGFSLINNHNQQWNHPAARRTGDLRVWGHEEVFFFFLDRKDKRFKQMPRWFVSPSTAGCFWLSEDKLD